MDARPGKIYSGFLLLYDNYTRRNADKHKVDPANQTASVGCARAMHRCAKRIRIFISSQFQHTYLKRAFFSPNAQTKTQYPLKTKDFAKNNPNIQNQQIRQNCQNGQNQFLEIVFIKVYVILIPNMCLYTATQ